MQGKVWGLKIKECNGTKDNEQVRKGIGKNIRAARAILSDSLIFRKKNQVS